MSYLSHFNLQEQPFRLTPDPDFLYWSKQHARAKAYMESTIWLADGFVVITGEIGSGKTTLLQSFLSELDDDVVYAVISQTQLTPTEFLQSVLTEFGFKPFNKRKVELLDMLNMFLIEQYSNGKKVVLLVDEGQNLTRKVLEEIRLISGIETHKEKVLRIILAGQPELRDKLDTPRLKQLMQRVRLKFHLGPLDRREMGEYIDHRLAVAGCEKENLFGEDTHETIYRYTGGLPRLINTLCDTALLCAFADEKNGVGLDDVLAAVDELNWEEQESDTNIDDKLQRFQRVASENNHVMRIEVRADGEVINELSLPAGRIIIGRSPDNEVFIKSKFVSRHHAQLITDDDGCMIEDLNSTNGIFLGEKQIKKYRLRDGDVVSLGAHEVVYYDLRQHQYSTEDQLDDTIDDRLDDDDDQPDDDRLDDDDDQLDDDRLDDDDDQDSAINKS